MTPIASLDSTTNTVLRDVTWETLERLDMDQSDLIHAIRVIRPPAPNSGGARVMLDCYRPLPIRINGAQ